MKKSKKGAKVKFRTLPFSVNVIVEDQEGAVGYITEDFEELEGVVHYNGDVTVVILEDGSKGVATKGPRDEYDPEIGKEVAFRRAYIEMLQKEIKEISGPRVY